MATGVIISRAEDQSEQKDFASFVMFSILIICLVVVGGKIWQKVEQLNKKIVLLERRIRAVKDHAEEMRKGSIEDKLEIMKRVFELERKISL